MRKSSCERLRCGLMIGTIAAVITAVTLAVAAWADEDWAWRVVERSVEAVQQVAHEGYRDVVLFRNGEKVAGFHQKVSRDRGRRERVVVLQPPSQQGRLEVCDGETRWEYFPRANQVIVSKVPPRRPLGAQEVQPHSGARSRLHAKYLGDGQVANRSAHIIELASHAGRPVSKLWVDREKFVQLKVQRFCPRGSVTQSAYFTRISFNPQFPPGLFSFTPPPSCRIVRVPPELPRMVLAEAEQRVGFKAKLPPYLPEGFALERDSVAVPRMRKHLVLWLPFSNGVDRFSLFQGPRSLEIGKGGKHRGESWTAGDFCFVLVGSLPTEEARKIKASMEK